MTPSMWERGPFMFLSWGTLDRCGRQTSLSIHSPPSASLAVCLLLLAHSSHSLPGIRPQLRCCDSRWQLAQKGWHVIGKCAAPKMSRLIKRFWSVVNCKNEGQHVVGNARTWYERIIKKCTVQCTPLYSICSPLSCTEKSKRYRLSRPDTKW